MVAVNYVFVGLLLLVAVGFALAPLAIVAVSSAFYAETHPEAWSSPEETVERAKVAKKKEQRLQKALGVGKETPV